MQASSAPFQPQYLPQQPQYHNQGMPPAMYYTVPPNQPMQQSQQPNQTSNPTIQMNNRTKPKPKRTKKIVIRDLKNHKDVTEQILSHTSAANGRSGSTPPLTNSTAQTESSIIQAQFVARFAARVGGEKCKQDNEKKTDETDKNKQLQERTDHEIRTEVNKQGNGSIAANEIHAKDLPPNDMETLNKVSSSGVENRTESPKYTTGNTHLNQGSQTLQEITEKLKKNMKSDGREATIKSGASEKKEKATDVSDKVPENNVNTAEGKTSNENMVNPGPVEQIKSDNKDSSLDNAQNGVEGTKSLDSEAAHADISSDETGKKVEAISDSKEVVGQQPTQTSNPAIQTHNLTKPKPKRTSKIVIRDPQMLEHSLSKGRWL
jgi:hypothetical protein